LGNRALQIPSVLFLKPDGEFLVGEAAERRGLNEPDRLAREFKRRIGDPVPILVAGAPFSPQALTAHLLRWVVATASERMGESPNEVILTHPANWGPFRLELLDQVAVMAGVTTARRCTEPEAAAAQYAAQTRINPGDKVAVYDLGGGTFDACILEKTNIGFRALGTPEGVEHLGGIDFDQAVLRHVLTTLNTPLDPDDPEVTIGLARLRRDCVEAKEALSTDVDTLVPVALPGLTTTVRITRAEFELMIRPALSETLAAMTRALRNAAAQPSQLRSILLVGGSSRIPLVSEMLHREFNVPTALDIHPKHDIALGALRTEHDNANLVSAAPPAPVTPLPQPFNPGPLATSEAETTPAAQPPRAVRPSAGAPRGVARETDEPAAPPPARAEAATAAVSASVAGVGPDGDGAGGDRTPLSAGNGGTSTPPPGGLGRVLVVVVAAVMLGVGAGAFIALRDRGAADPPAASTPPATVVSSPVASPSPSPTPSPTAAIPQSAEPLGNEVIVWPRARDGNWDIALLDLESGTETPLTTDPLEDSFPVITRDRRSIFYHQTTDAGPVLRVMAADGEGDREFFDELPDGCEIMRRPAITPDDQLVVMCAATEDPERVLLNVINLDGQLVRRLASIGRMADPTVTPDGQSVIYWRNDEGDGDGGALYRAAIDGESDPVQLTDGGDGQDADPVVSPDGEQIAFRRIIDGERVVVTAPFDGEELTDSPTQVTKGENDQDPSWSPDGGRIAYKQGPNNNADLRVVDLESRESTVVVENSEPDTAPAWTTR
jgi:actin-like ATPase involved in cell morphogenesis